VHVLGYFVDITHPDLLRELTRFQQARQERIREMVARLNQRGVGLRPEAVFALANCRSPGRPHVARALVQHGFCRSLEEAFERFLKKHRPAWVPKCKISARQAIELIHTAGGLAVMAHPGLNHSDALIPALAEVGLDGLECWHTKHTPAQAAHYLELARRHGLLVTGGSDCHGTSKGQPTLGEVRLAWEHYLRLKNAPRPTAALA
jgi:predicted metal-dependent phosphoesterase TrpH